jgi:aspartyl-tRNA(Asn)/glutamyl-tRNA(Gln) amidotransferase subunit B
MVDAGQLSSTAATQLFLEVIKTSKDPAVLANRLGLMQVSDSGEIIKIVDQVIKGNPKAAQDVKNGETKAIGFLVGQVMKLSKGQANPKLAQDLIKKQLEQL